jgi:hypothetical protein
MGAVGREWDCGKVMRMGDGEGEVSGKVLMGKAQMAGEALLFLPQRRNLGMLGAEVERK